MSITLSSPQQLQISYPAYCVAWHQRCVVSTPRGMQPSHSQRLHNFGSQNPRSSSANACHRRHNLIQMSDEGVPNNATHHHRQPTMPDSWWSTPCTSPREPIHTKGFQMLRHMAPASPRAVVAIMSYCTLPLPDLKRPDSMAHTAAYQSWCVCLDSSLVSRDGLVLADGAPHRGTHPTTWIPNWVVLR